MLKHQLTRRSLLQAGGLGLLSTAIPAAFPNFATGALAQDGGLAGPNGLSAKEAPILAERVAAGTLPPLAERLPANPMVITPVESPGLYGGEWRTAIRSPSDSAWLYRTIGYDQLTRWGWEVDASEPQLNMAEQIEVLDDAKRYIIHLRKGVKWSDGAPFTSADVIFAYDDVLRNEALYPTLPTWLVSGGEPAVFTAIDDATVEVTFKNSYGLFPSYLGLAEGRPLTLQPKHYLEQFHIKYNPDADKLAQDQGLAGWAALFGNKGIITYPGNWQNAELPSLNAWYLTQAFGTGTRLVAERNPYYWKVDSEGRQLPYIDRLVFDIINDPEVMLLKATNGEIDMHTRHIVNSANKPVLARARESADIEFFDIIPSGANELGIALNLTHKDPVIRALFSDKNFRIGLSHAINRPEIIELSFEGQGEPWQVAPRPEGPFYDEEMAKQFTEYDLALANEFLDKAGITNRDGENYRTMSDGRRVSIIINTDVEDSSVLEKVRQQWAEVGIEMRAQTLDRALFFERVGSNDFDATVWFGDAGLYDAIFFPRWWFPSEEYSFYGILWAHWYMGVEPKEEPPANILKQQQLFDQVKAATDTEQRIALFRELLAINKELFPAIGISLPAPGYGIKKTNFHNVPTPMGGSSPFPYPGTGNSEQFFMGDV
jgi:peptide/nickel transport system substrate-binding protein